MKIGMVGLCNGLAFFFLLALFTGFLPFFTEARNIAEYSDTISDSKPLAQSNHTLRFTVIKAVAPGSVIDIQFPPDFIVASSTLTFAERNVELYVDGVARDATTTPSATVDGISIVRGAGGRVQYTLSDTEGIAAEANLELRIGNQTALSLPSITSYSTSTGTTTTKADIKPITNSEVMGTKMIDFSITGDSEPMYAQFNIAVIPGIYVGDVDTTETIPPYRFNPAPTSTVGGTTLFVEISLETDEFSICRYATSTDIVYSAMPKLFESTGLIVHSSVVPVVRGAINTYYVRCLDDEGNFNTDDFLIQFVVNDAPTGQSTTEGSIEGTGTGTGDSGSGAGSGGGGTIGGTEGDSSTTGNSSGSGGSGGGAGGRTGVDSSGATGGGLESVDGLYPSGDAEVIISGYAFPGSTVYAIVDGAAAGNVKASNDGRYTITISQIARGAYTFGIYALDRNKTKSSTFSTSFTVTGGRTSSLSNVNVMPSIKVSPDPVNPGQSLVMSGYSIPAATVTLENQRDGSSISRREFTTTSDASGIWQITIDTNGFTRGTYKVRAKAKATSGLIETSYSNYTFYGVGQSANIALNSDLNTDGKVNLIDFSILLFWWGRDGGNSNPPADINRDGSVSLTDFSILLFNWTG